MSTSEFLAYDRNSVAVRPLAELPMLRLADRAQDVRRWEVYGRDGRRIGIVADLLVDIDRLRSDTLLVSVVEEGRSGALVVAPLQGLALERGSNRRLVRGEGIPPIAVRYQSTTRYAIWGVVAVAAIALAGWILGFFG